MCAAAVRLVFENVVDFFVVVVVAVGIYLRWARGNNLYHNFQLSSN